MHDLSDDVHTEKWYEVCARIFKSMSWRHSGTLLPEMDNTIINVWCWAGETLDLENWNYSTSYIFE